MISDRVRLVRSSSTLSIVEAVKEIKEAHALSEAS